MKKDADDMTTQEILTAIRTEIERLKRQLIRGACAAQVSFETSCKDEAYNEILSFLGTLEGNSEKPNNHLEHVPEIKETGTRDLDEAAERFIQDKVDAAGHPGWDWETRDVFDAFKAGAEWRDRMLNWARDIVQAGIDKPEEAVNILKRLKDLL